MPQLTADGLHLVTEVATRHGFSADAALGLLDALLQGGGFQAQFNHPEFGGMGQWSQGGMIMVGDMFNQGLKYRVDALCNDLAALLREQPSIQAPSPSFLLQSQLGAGVSLFVQGGSGSWWPAELGSPASSGAQNDMRYAVFPASRRLALQIAGKVRVYDTGDHRFSGFSQQQGADQSLTFNSQYGTVRVADLPLASADGEAAETRTPESSPLAPALARAQQPAPPATLAVDEILKLLEGLAALREKNILTESEFAAKKAELLSRI